MVCFWGCHLLWRMNKFLYWRPTTVCKLTYIPLYRKKLFAQDWQRQCNVLELICIFTVYAFVSLCRNQFNACGLNWFYLNLSVFVLYFLIAYNIRDFGILLAKYTSWYQNAFSVKRKQCEINRICSSPYICNVGPVWVGTKSDIPIEPFK